MSSNEMRSGAATEIPSIGTVDLCPDRNAECMVREQAGEELPS
jgi:hypothetical protein